MIDYALLSAFIPTFMLVSATPGMCMTLSLSLGMSIGVKKTLWMMLGELVGVGLVALLAVLGVAQIMLNYPLFFTLLKYLGGSYLVYSGVEQWRNNRPVKFALPQDLIDPNAPIPSSQKASELPYPTRSKLIKQGFITAIANPKGWAFMISLLPPFINPQLALAPQLSLLLLIILITEFGFLLVYANGGQKLKQLLQKQSQVHRLYQFSGGLLFLIGVWLILG